MYHVRVTCQPSPPSLSRPASKTKRPPWLAREDLFSLCFCCPAGPAGVAVEEEEVDSEREATERERCFHASEKDTLKAAPSSSSVLLEPAPLLQARRRQTVGLSHDLDSDVIGRAHSKCRSYYYYLLHTSTGRRPLPGPRRSEARFLLLPCPSPTLMLK